MKYIGKVNQVLDKTAQIRVFTDLPSENVM